MLQGIRGSRGISRVFQECTRGGLVDSVVFIGVPKVLQGVSGPSQRCYKKSRGFHGRSMGLKWGREYFKVV